MQPTLPAQSLKLKKDRRSGAALVLAALSLLVLVPMLGLAIDGANVYLERNQLNVAMSAAVLAATRSLNVGQTAQAQSASAQAVASQVFKADVGSSLSVQSCNVAGACVAAVPSFTVSPDDSSHFRTVSGSLSVDLPLTFMAMMNFNASNTAHVNINVAATRRDVNIMLVLDNGGPMSGAGGTNINPMASMQADAIAFVNLFANSRDNIGLVSFTSAPWVAEALPNQNFASNVPTDVNTLQATDTGVPNTAAALSTAYQQLRNLNQPGALNVIVLFTDGVPVAFSGNFAGLVKTGQSVCSPSANPLNGVLWSPPDASAVYGLTDPTAQKINDDPEDRTPSGCISSNYSPGSFLNSMPSVDLYNNATNGSYAAVNLSSIDTADVIAASENALDSAANTIHNDTALQPVIFTIGLNGNYGLPPDPVLLAKVANDPTSSYYSSSFPTGQSIIAPSSSQLQAAFTSIASQVLRLAAVH